jgi:hypothetical protein
MANDAAAGCRAAAGNAEERGPSIEMQFCRRSACCGVPGSIGVVPGAAFFTLDNARVRNDGECGGDRCWQNSRRYLLASRFLVDPDGPSAIHGHRLSGPQLERLVAH